MTDAQHVLLVNPNTNEQTTSLMTALMRPILASAGLDTVGATVSAGPPLLTTPDVLAASVPHVIECVQRSLTSTTLAVVVAAIGDPGVDELRASIDIPVLGIGESGVRAASTLGIPFGMITTTRLLGPGLLRLVERYGDTDSFTGIRYTPSAAEELANDRARQLAELTEAASESVCTDGARAVIVGGGPLGDAARILAESTTSVIVEPLPSAARLALQTLGAGARPSAS